MMIQRIGVCIAIGFGMMFGIASCFGQGFQSRFSMTEGVLLPAPREVEVLLEDARDAIERKQWSEASLALGVLLGIEDGGSGRDLGEDYFIFRDRNGAAIVEGTVLGAAHELLATMPDEGRKVVELRYGVKASQLLEEAVERSGWDVLRELSSRYSFTTAGQDALLLLAERALSDGETAQAAGMYGRLLGMESARNRYGASLGVMTVAAYRFAGMPAEAKKALATTRENFVSVSLDWNGSKIGWNDKTTDEAILQSLATDSVDRISRTVDRPAYPGGDSKRNANTLAGLPLPILRWHQELHESFQHKDNLDRTLKKQLAERKSVLIPSRYPISVDSWVITPTYDQRILAIDARSGRIGWPCVFSGMPLGFSLDRFAGKDGYSLGMSAPDYLVRRVWGETAIGQIASDGERLFSISESPALDVAESFAQGPNARFARNLGMKTYNVLQAWSIRDQGKLVWEVGGPTGLSAPELAEALFLGAPLPQDGELFCLIELNGEIFLASIASDTGKLLWRQPIAANQGNTISIDQQRRAYGASPAVSGTIVVCPTLSGYLVAYDLGSRELLWQFKYPLNPNIIPGAQFNFIGGMDLRESNPTLPRSVETSVLLHNGVAVFAPPNGNAVYGVSLTDGDELWQYGYDEQSLFRYCAGAWDNIAVLVQASSVVGVDLKTGQAAWPAVPLPGDAQVVGRGVRSGSKFYLPISTQEILELDMEKGQILGSARVEKPLGNLIVVGDRLISASPFELDCYSIRDVFRTKLLEELKEDGDSVQGWVKQGELAMASGDIEGALGFLEKARDKSPEDPDVKLLLVKVGTEALRRDFDKYVDRVQKYQEMTLDLDLPSYLRILIHGLEKQGRWEEMFVKLVELSDTRLNRRIDQMSDGQDIDLNAQWTVQEDRWLSTRIARCVEKIPEGAWSKLGSMVQSRLDPAVIKDGSMLRLRLDHFQSLEFAEPLRILAAKAIASSSAIDAERMLQQRTPDNAPLSAAKKLALAELYLRASRPFLALRYAEGNIAAIKQMMEKINSESRQFAMRTEIDTAQLERFAAAAKSATDPHVWPKGRVDVTTQFTENPNGRAFDAVSDSSSLCTIVESIGDAFQDWQVYYNAGNLQFVNPMTGELFQQMVDMGALDRSTVPRIHTVDSLVYIELKNQLIAIDTLQAYTSQQDGQLWRHSYGEETPEFDRGRGRVISIERNAWGLPVQKKAFRVAAVSRSGVIILNNDELVCLDAITGNKVWGVTGFRNSSFVHKEDVLHVYHPASGKLIQIDIRDGMIIESRDGGQDGWLPMATVGKRWLFAPVRAQDGDRASEMKLRLIDPIDGKVILAREHTIDTRLAMVGEYGIAAMRSDGQMYYWNVETNQEFNYTVDVEGKFSIVTAQVFGDVALVLPYAGSMELEKIIVNPSQRNDPSVAACAGKLFAISVRDGKPVWERSQRVKHFMFPISQRRNSPAAVFVRRLSLTKIRGVNLDFTSVALVDIKTGRLLFQKHDMPAIRGEGFRQMLVPKDNVMIVNYLGNTITAKWTEDESGLAPLDRMDEIGELDAEEYRKHAEEMIDEITSKQGVGGQDPPSKSLPPLPNLGGGEPK